MMKRIKIILTLLIVTCTFIACGSSGGGSGPNTGEDITGPLPSASENNSEGEDQTGSIQSAGSSEARLHFNKEGYIIGLWGQIYNPCSNKACEETKEPEDTIEFRRRTSANRSEKSD